jgi:glycosyltransferase involved in cell wall biosynthesis
MLRRAIECFRWQTYPSDHRELLILDDGDLPAESVVTTFSGAISSIHYWYEAPKALLGQKRNRLAERARGDVFVLWDDDDWHGPERLATQLAALARSRLTSYDRVRVQDVDGIVWEPPSSGWTFPGTMAFHRSVWEEAGFPSQGTGADLEFFHQHRGDVTPLDGTHHYRVIRHVDHRTPFDSSGWIRRGDVRTINVAGGL